MIQSSPIISSYILWQYSLFSSLYVILRELTSISTFSNLINILLKYWILSSILLLKDIFYFSYVFHHNLKFINIFSCKVSLFYMFFKPIPEITFPIFYSLFLLFTLIFNSLFLTLFYIYMYLILIYIIISKNYILIVTSNLYFNRKFTPDPTLESMNI